MTKLWFFLTSYYNNILYKNFNSLAASDIVAVIGQR